MRKVFFAIITIYRPLEYKRVYLPLYKVADTPFHIQEDGMSPADLNSSKLDALLDQNLIADPNTNLNIIQNVLTNAKP